MLTLNQMVLSYSSIPPIRCRAGKYLLVESRRGWYFHVPHSESDSKGVEKVKITLDVEVAARVALRKYLGIQVDD